MVHNWHRTTANTLRIARHMANDWPLGELSRPPLVEVKQEIPTM
jgi:hypothetical protein